jgi:ferredoxin
MAGINDKCIGCGTCSLMAPELFKMEGIPAQLIKQPTPEEKEQYDLARGACPVEAIEEF